MPTDIRAVAMRLDNAIIDRKREVSRLTQEIDRIAEARAVILRIAPPTQEAETPTQMPPPQEVVVPRALAPVIQHDLGFYNAADLWEGLRLAADILGKVHTCAVMEHDHPVEGQEMRRIRSAQAAMNDLALTWDRG